MCIVYLALQAHPDWPLFIAANRDEFHARASLAAAPWPERRDIIAGIDCQGRGTWLGMTAQGRYSLLTNYRDLAAHNTAAPTRGALVSRYLTGTDVPDDYAAQVSAAGAAYNGFNLIVGDLNQACYVSNRTEPQSPRKLEQDQRYVLSNHLIDTAWPKAERLRRALDSFPLERLADSLTEVFNILKDGTPATDSLLPDTGLPRERERLLSSPFIISPDYGTRCSTVIAVHASGRAIFSETSYGSAGQITQRHDWPFYIRA